ncbi:MAG: hypothetical protein GX254_07580 [Clostridiales bacterium]|jgi:hypothetical protein|nr:hypothetical protein [Clostridiales bacterium]
MKKLLFLLPAVLYLVLLTGCQAGNSPDVSSSPTVSAQVMAEARPVKTGLAFITSLDKSTSAGESDGFAQADSLIAAVTVDGDGRITSCVIDAVEIKAFFDSSGRIVTALDTDFPTKNEMGREYGMKEASAIGKEWNEQAAFLAEYLIGKTADEIKGISVSEKGYAEDTDLRASVTISMGGYIDAVLKAMENPRDLGATTADKIGVGVVTNIIYSNNAGAANGSVLVYSTFVALTTNTEGRITSCIADGFQCNVNFNASGKIVSDLKAVPPTKNETGYDYGLKDFSSLGKEWFEQTEALAQHVTGKTAAEIESIAVREDTSPASEDMRATVTLKIGEFKKAIAKAFKSIT